MQSKPPTRKANIAQDVCRAIVWWSYQSAIIIYIHTIWVFCVSHYFQNYIYERPKVDMIVLGNRPKSTQQNRRNNVQQFSPVFYFFITSKSTLFCWKKKIYQIRSPFMQFYSFYRDTCMYKNFCKSNHKQYIEIKGGFFVLDNIKNLGNILLLSNAKIRNLAFIEN